MVIKVKKNIGQLIAGNVYRVVEELPFDYVLDVDGENLEYISKEPVGTETEYFSFMDDKNQYEKAMYILLNKEGSLNNAECIDISTNLVFDYLFENFILNNQSSNLELYKTFSKFHKDKKIKIISINEEAILELKEQYPDLIIIRDKGLTHLKPNTLTCATFGIKGGVFILIMNSDIKLKKGKLFGQVGHCMCSYLYHSYIKDTNMDTAEIKDYMNVQKKISLNCSKEDLNRLIRKYNPIIYNYKEQLFINLGIVLRDIQNEIYLDVKDFKLY